MGSVNKIDSIYDVAAITSQHDAVKKLVQDSIAQVLEARTKSIDFNINTKSFSDFNTKSKELEKSISSLSKTQIQLAAAHKEVQRLIKARMESEAKLVTLQTDYARETAKNRVEIQKTNAELKAQSSLDKAESGSRNRAIAAIKVLKQERDKLNLTTEEGRKRQEQLNQSIDKYDAFLKKTASSLEKQKINVGNYSGAVKTLEKAMLDIKSKIDSFSQSGLQNDAVLQDLNKEYELLNTLVNNQANGFISMKTEIRENQAAIEQLSKVYGEDSAIVQKLIKENGQLTDSLGDLKAQQKTLGSDSFVFDGLLQAGQALAGTYGAITGATALFGEENEDLQKQMVKLQAVMALVQGVQATVNALQKEGAAVQLFYSIQTKAAAAAQTLFAFATGGATVATKALRIALLATGIGAVVVLLGTLISAYNDSSDSTDDQAESQEELNKRMEEYVNQLQAAVDAREKFRTSQKGGLNEAKRELALLEASGAAAEKIFKQKQLVANEELRNLEIAFHAFEGFEDKRVEIAEKAKDKRNEILIQQAEFQKGINDKAISDAEDAEKAKEKAEAKRLEIIQRNRDAESEISKLKLEDEITFLESIVDDEQRGFDQRLKFYSAYAASRIKLIELEAKAEIAEGGKTTKELELIELKKNTAIYNAQVELLGKLDKLKKDAFKSTTLESFETVDLSKIPPELQARIDAFKKVQEEAIKTAKTEEELAAKLKPLYENLATEIEGLFFDIFTNQIEQQKNAIQDQIDLLDQQKQKDIEVADQTITNAQDKADAIAVIEARAAAKKQQLELKQRQLDQQKARFEKAQAIASIIQSTAIAVVNALGAKPWTPANIALAAIVGAIGAVQIARTLAQPIPRYAEGTSNHPGGPMIVGDGGKSEGIILPDGSIYKSPATDTLMTAPAGTQVIPDYATMTKAPVFNVDTIDTTAELRKGFGQVVKAVKNIPQPVIHAEKAWVQAHRQGSNFRNYLNRSI